MNFSVRPIIEGDLEMIMNWRMSPEVTRYMNTNPKLTIEGQRKWLHSLEEKNDVKYWIIEVAGTPAGVICLVDIDYEKKNTSWGYYIGEIGLRSMQLAISLELSLYAYVFGELCLDEIRCEVFSLNEGVIKLHQLCGCQIVKIVEDEVYKDGVQYNVTHLSLTRAAWKENRSKYRYEKIAFC